MHRFSSIAAVVALLVVAGCGSGDGGAAAPQATATVTVTATTEPAPGDVDWAGYVDAALTVAPRLSVEDEETMRELSRLLCENLEAGATFEDLAEPIPDRRNQDEAQLPILVVVTVLYTCPDQAGNIAWDAFENTASAAPAPEPKPEPKPVVLPGDGTFLVGTDIPAGTYRNDGAQKGTPLCVVYASKEPADVTTHLRGSTSKGPAILKLNDGEYVTTAYCKDFTRVP